MASLVYYGMEGCSLGVENEVYSTGLFRGFVRLENNKNWTQRQRNLFQQGTHDMSLPLNS